MGEEQEQGGAKQSRNLQICADVTELAFPQFSLTFSFVLCNISNILAS